MLPSAETFGGIGAVAFSARLKDHPIGKSRGAGSRQHYGRTRSRFGADQVVATAVKCRVLPITSRFAW
jgi:hypothetical protein